MSYQRKRSSDGSAEAAGCLMVLLSVVTFLFGKAVYERLRYKPPPYHPAAPHIPHEAGMPYQTKVRLMGVGASAVIFGITYINISSNPAPYISKDAILWLIATLLAVGYTWYMYDRYKETKFDVSSINASSLFPTAPRIFTLYPAKQGFDGNGGLNLMAALLDSQAMLTFQIVADTDAIVWQVIDPTGKANPQAIITTIRSHLSDVRVVEEPLQADETERVYRQTSCFRLANEYAAPISFIDLLKNDDPLIALTRAMDFLESEQRERVTYTLTILTDTPLGRARAWERLKEGSIVPLSSVPTAKLDTNLHGLDDRQLERKLNSNLYHAFLTLTIESRDKQRLDELSPLITDITRFGIPASNHISLAKTFTPHQIVPKKSPLFSDVPGTLFAAWETDTALWKSLLLVLHPLELASLWHVPDERFTAEHIAWAGTPVPDSVVTEGQDRMVLGTTAGRGTSQKVYLSLQDRAFHTAIIGKTGTGKSTLLHTLIHQDIAAGRGVVVIDPHGKLINDLLARSIPNNRASQLVLLELGKTEYPVPLNPFRIPEGLSRETAFTFIYWVFRKLYESVWRDRMDFVFRNVIQTLLTDPHATPRDISRVLLNTQYRETLVTALDESEYSLKEFWTWYEAQPKSEQMEIASPILTRAQAFLGNKQLELMTCHPESLDFAGFIQYHNIVLINLSGSAIQAESGTLGAILLSQLFVAAQHLGYLADGVLPRSYVYVDEVERIVTTPLPEMFATARKFGLSLTLANQYLKQLSPDTLEGILGNVGTRLVFEVGESDSRSLAKLFEPDLARDSLMKLGTYQMAVKTRSQGESLAPFIVKTLPPPKQATTGAKGQTKKAASPVSTMTSAQVAEWLKQRYRVKPPKKSSETVSTDGLSDYE